MIYVTVHVTSVDRSFTTQSGNVLGIWQFVQVAFLTRG
jgi:hypothetical protein